MQTLSDGLRLRYGTNDTHDDTPEPAWSDALALLLSHRSVRAYTTEPLPQGTLEAMVAAAQSASSSSNLQAWSVIAIEDAARKDRLARLAGDQEQIRECPLLLVWIADLSRLERVAEQQQLPHAALDYTEMFLLAAIDAALAAQNAAVAAEALGLGIVYIGGMRDRPLDVAAELQLPARAFAVFGMCVGWPDPQRPTAVKPRLPQAGVVHREVYDSAAEPQAITQYDQAMATFYTEQGMRAAEWTTHSARRVAGPETLSGRDTLVAALHQLGFELR